MSTQAVKLSAQRRAVECLRRVTAELAADPGLTFKQAFDKVPWRFTDGLNVLHLQKCLASYIAGDWPVVRRGADLEVTVRVRVAWIDDRTQTVALVPLDDKGEPTGVRPWTVPLADLELFQPAAAKLEAKTA